MRSSEEIKNEPGVYCILNLVNGKVYIGSSTSLLRRYKSHVKGLRNGHGQNDLIQRAYNKYGEENFMFIILEKCINDRKIILEREQVHMDFNKSYIRENGYNLAILARNNTGYKKNDEQRERSRIARRLWIDEHPEYREYMSMAMSGKNNHRFGKTNSDKQKNAVAEYSRNREVTEELKEKIRNSNLGQVRSEETRRNMRKPRSNEGRKNMAAAAKLRNKAITQYDIDGNKIKTWESTLGIFNELGFSRGNIALACRTGVKRYNFYWKYE